jgi:hypothetical protein
MTVLMVTPEQAAVMLQTTPRVIYRKVENSELHFVETSEGELFICLQNVETHTKQL